MHRAPLWMRFLAYILDSLIVIFIISLPFYYSFKLVKGYKPFLEIFWLTPLVIAYFAATEANFNASLGKMLVGLKVESLEGELEGWQAVTRNLTKFSPVLLLLDTINCFLNEKDQRFSEVIAKTKVVQK